jgi:hypothetical protein
MKTPIQLESKTDSATKMPSDPLAQNMPFAGVQAQLLVLQQQNLQTHGTNVQNNPVIAPQAPMGQHSNFASKYGVRAIGDLKSNLTPLQDAFPTLRPTPNLEEKEDYQRQMFYGFTSNELNRLDCFPTRQISPGDLAGGILPMLQPDRWEVTPCQPDFTRDHLYPITNGTGNWIMSNPQVGNIMQQPLKIASRIMSSVQLLPWVWHFSCICR